MESLAICCNIRADYRHLHIVDWYLCILLFICKTGNSRLILLYHNHWAFALFRSFWLCTNLHHFNHLIVYMVHIMSCYLVHYRTCSSGSGWIVSWTPDWRTCLMISCAPVSHSPWAFCWVEPSRRQNPHLSQHEDRTCRDVGGERTLSLLLYVC